MSVRRGAALTAIRDVRAALETLAGALAGADLDALLRAEPTLQTAIAHLSTQRVPRDERAALATELAAMTGSLTRCRVLGQALTDAIAIFAHARGETGGYTRDGREQAASGSRRSLEARV